MKKKTHQFTFQEFDMSEYLNNKWDKEIISFAIEKSIYQDIFPTSVTSREPPNVTSVSVSTIDGKKLREQLDWLFELYEKHIFALAKTCVDEELFLAKNDLYALNLNIQKGDEMRYECHVDSNPLQGVLYVTNHPEGAGGELVVSNNPDAIGMGEIDEDCKIYYPESGKLILFNAMYNPHYVRPLKSKEGIRVALTLNFYTTSNPETARPPDLSDHLRLTSSL